MRFERGLFQKEATAWIAVLLYTAVLYSTLTFAFDFYVSIYDRIGRESMSWQMNFAFAVAGALLLFYVAVRVRPKASGYLTLVLIGLIVAFCLTHLEVPAKRFHFFQYAPLTLLVFEALRFRSRDRGIFVWAIALVGLIGLGDETVQWMLPDRHFGLLDVLINATAGLLTLSFIGFVLGEEKYPWGAPARPAGRESRDALPAEPPGAGGPAPDRNSPPR